MILAALRSQTGASHRLLLTIGHPDWQIVITPAVMYEYEDAAKRPGMVPGLSQQDIGDILNYLYQMSHKQFVRFSWRPLSPDPGDDAILEAAIAGGCDFVVSFNERHLRAAKDFGIKVIKPADLLNLIGEIK